VEIKVTNTGTGISVQRTADSSGAYSVPDLQAGTYDITVTKSGFRTYAARSVVLLASQTVRVDAQLQVGDTQQQVTVTAQAPLINTEGPEIHGEISSRQMADLPLAQQSIDGLMVMVPGMQGSASTPNVGGAPYIGGTNFTLNGTRVNDVGSGMGSASSSMGMISLPALSSLGEFKVDAFNNDAEYTDVATVTLVTKSGTNQFHGEAYEYNQNADLSANTLLNNAAGIPRPAAVFNQFGGSLGGRILRDKLFFFVDYSGVRNRAYSSTQLNLPTMDMRQGNFSALPTQLYDPFTGAAFNSNQIPSTLITTQAQTLMTYLPKPTTLFTGAGLPNAAPDYYGLVSSTQDMNDVESRFDYRISAMDLLYGTMSYNKGEPWTAAGPSPTYGGSADNGYRTINVSLVETHTFSPRALNDLRLAYFDYSQTRSGQNLDFVPQSLFPQLPTSPNRGLPTMNFTGYPTMFNDQGLGFPNHGADYELTDNFTYVRGSHTIKAGTDITELRSYQPTNDAELGNFSFSGQWTGNKGWPGYPQSVGNAFADFMLGTVDSDVDREAANFENFYNSWATGYYVQDTWQTTPHLTLTFALARRLIDLLGSYNEPTRLAGKFHDGYPAALWRLGGGVCSL
jgi:hypothetical protein